MAENSSVDQYQRFLEEKFNEFRTSFTHVLKTISLDNKNDKAESAKDLISRIGVLKNNLSSNDRPPWLDGLEQRLGWYLQNQNNADRGVHLLASMIEHFPAIQSHKWAFTPEESRRAIDIAAIYDRRYSNSRAPALFEALLGQLEEIVKSGAIDSIQAISSLERLIATIRKNVHGGYLSTFGTWKIVDRFFKNLSIEIFESIPIVRVPFKAARKTIAELDEEMTKIVKGIEDDIIIAAEQALPLPQNASVLLLNANYIPPKATPLLAGSDEHEHSTVIDVQPVQLESPIPPTLA